MSLYKHLQLSLTGFPVTRYSYKSQATQYRGTRGDFIEVVIWTQPDNYIRMEFWVEGPGTPICDYQMKPMVTYGAFGFRQLTEEEQSCFRLESLSEEGVVISVRDIAILPNGNIECTRNPATCIFGPQGLLAAPELYPDDPWPSGPKVGMTFLGRRDEIIFGDSACHGINLRAGWLYSIYYVNNTRTPRGNERFYLNTYNPSTRSMISDNWCAEWDDIFKKHFEYLGNNLGEAWEKVSTQSAPFEEIPF